VAGRGLWSPHIWADLHPDRCAGRCGQNRRL